MRAAPQPLILIRALLSFQILLSPAKLERVGKIWDLRRIWA